MKGFLFGLSVLVLLAALAVGDPQAPAQPAPKDGGISFVDQISPVLKASCIGCHGANTPMDLTTPEGISKYIVAKDPARSKLMHALNGTDGVKRMPMGAKPLATDVIRLFERWIAEGARFKDPVDFSLDIAPIIRASCLNCHADSPAAGLDLRKQADIATVISPGNPEKSTLLTRVKGEGGMERMPKGFPALPSKEIDLIERWIAEGASFAPTGRVKVKHWAYRPLATPNPPSGGHPIDAFVAARLEKEDLAFSPLADPATRLRRVYLDIIGLPPTPAEVQAFLKNPSAAEYSQVVDRLLKNPQYGVRQARPWLDLARYADTNGFEKDNSRSIWPYRDWVINAFNKNMPFDQFTIEQVAGDLLPNATRDQIVATGFNRNTMQNLEGGVDDGEAQYAIISDRVNTTATVWMGSTLACARCHDHKFDEISHKDYFSFYAFFNKPNVRLVGSPPFETDLWENELWLYGPGQEEELKRLREARAAAKNPMEQKRLDTQISLLVDRIPKTRVMGDDPKIDIPKTFVKARGEYRADAEPVTPRTPEVFGEMPPELPKNRLGLAKWLVSDQNPMAARVHVNRVWEQYFGRGIVETVDDFGVRSAPPSHPELLEWLASEFVKSGWDQKWLHRTIVTSRTYQQSSKVSKEMLELDPYNELLARGPRFRMEAEMIRDSLLHASGLLSTKIGGPSVMPYQPEGTWNSPYSGEYWQMSSGVDRYRRGIFTFVKRTAPYPSFMTFDSGSREECLPRRLRTNTPLQALVLMNDPVYLESAKVLATKLQRLGGSDDHRLSMAYLWVLSRPIRESERTAMKKLLEDQVKLYSAKPEEAGKLGMNVEGAAWLMVINVLMSTDEAITKG